MVRPGITGLLAPAEDVLSLRAAIVELLGCSEKRAEMAAACRRIVMKEYTLAKQVRHYVALYESALQRMISSIVPRRTHENFPNSSKNQLLKEKAIYD